MKTADSNLVINGLYVKSVATGFFGTNYNGKKMLKIMGLPKDVIPFDIVEFLKHGEAYWKDCDGNIAYISYKIQGNNIVCYGSYLGNKKKDIFTHNLRDTSTTMPARHCSRYIGESCMLCIYTKMIGKDESELGIRR